MMRDIPEFALWPIAPYGGDANEDNEFDENEDESNDDESEDESDDDESNDDEDENEEEDDDEDEFKGMSSAELKRRLKEAKGTSKKDAAELKRLRDAEEKTTRKKRTDLDNAKADVEKYKNESSGKDSIINKQAVRIAIGEGKTYIPHDVSDILHLIDYDDLAIEDGSVTGNDLEKQLKEIAKKKPHLFKSSKKDDDDDDNGNNSQSYTRRGATGSQPGQGVKGKTDKNAKDRQKLIGSYSALIGR